MAERRDKEKPQTISIKFEEFIKMAFPLTKNTPIPKITSTIVSNLESCCEQTEDGTFADVRGGAMCTFSLSTHQIEKSLIQKVRQTDFGDDELTRKVMEHAFSQEKDLDLFIRRGENSNDVITNNIDTTLSSIAKCPYDIKVETILKHFL